MRFNTMQFEHLTVVSPQFEAHAMSEAEVLGAAVWLWMHSDTHQGAPLTALNALLLPAIKTGQYLLAFEQGQPVAYVAWAQLDEPREAAYLEHSSRLGSGSDWCSGERGWFTDYIAPFGHTRQIRRILTHRLFPTGLFRFLYHKGDEKGLRVMTFHGIAVHPLEAQHWFKEHPVCWPTPKTSS